MTSLFARTKLTFIFVKEARCIYCTVRIKVSVNSNLEGKHGSGISDRYNLLEVSTDGAETWRRILPSNGQT